MLKRKVSKAVTESVREVCRILANDEEALKEIVDKYLKMDDKKQKRFVGYAAKSWVKAFYYAYPGSAMREIFIPLIEKEKSANDNVKVEIIIREI